MRRSGDPRVRGARKARGAWLVGLSLAVLACRPQPGLGAQLEIRAPQEDLDADVYVDGHYVGRIRALQGSPHSFKLAPGVHRVEIRKPGRFPVQETVRVEMTPLASTTAVVEAELLEDPLR